MKLMVTGGCGFIGSNFIQRLIKTTEHSLFNVDKLTYTGSARNHKEFLYHPRYCFEKTDICNMDKIYRILKRFKPDGLVHFAAESHVDKSIKNSTEFIGSNISGTHMLLECARIYCEEEERFSDFKFVLISTDEVYGSLDFGDPPFTEMSGYKPSSPYSASKAAADMLAKAWHKTYGIKTIITHSANNYGKNQYPEKLIPKTIFRAFDRKKIPIYGTGENIRDWIHVDDHCDAILKVLELGHPGETYNIGANNEWSNLEIAIKICDIVDALTDGKEPKSSPRRELVEHTADRPGHDKRYAVDSSKIQTQLGWKPAIGFQKGLEDIVSWYLAHRDYWL